MIDVQDEDETGTHYSVAQDELFTESCMRQAFWHWGFASVWSYRGVYIILLVSLTPAAALAAARQRMSKRLLSCICVSSLDDDMSLSFAARVVCAFCPKP